MKPVLQTRHGDDGDCVMACVASILECEIDDLPRLHKTNEDYWLTIVFDAVHSRGFKVILVGNDPPINPPGYAIALGESPRSGQRTVRHAVVALDGHVVHDPDRSRGGLERVEYWLVFVPRARSRQRTQPEQLESPI